MNKITLTDYHDAVVTWIKDNASWLQSVDYYPETRTELATPCAFFSVEDWEKSEKQRANGQLSLDVRCELILVFGMLEPEYQRAIRNAAMALSLLIDDARFGLTIPGAVLESASPDAFDPELDGYAVWSIRWLQRLDIGDIEISADEFKPSKILVGLSPDIGLGHEQDYEELP
ncbi:MAG: hypothetical protein ACPHV3_09650 [Vibrio sp.]